MQIIIIGCGKVGSSLARQLVALEHDVVIIESDSKLMLQADDIDCIKITGVPIDRDVLRQAGIETADVVCCVTQNDNINIMTSQIAQDVFHVPKIITRIFNPVNKDVFEEFGLNTICSTELTVDAFLREIEGEQNTQVHQLYGTPVVYTTVTTDRDILGDNICDLSTDTGKLVFGLIRNGRLMLAIPGLKVQEGDQLVLADLQ
ncbi:MAG: TrkA family potassium uptake protein [Eubacteriales bacterium]|nr:TrkA family potassium uptake protein [Eubacteriales bacterium]